MLPWQLVAVVMIKSENSISIMQCMLRYCNQLIKHLKTKKLYSNLSESVHVFHLLIISLSTNSITFFPIVHITHAENTCRLILRATNGKKCIHANRAHTLRK